MSEHCECGAPLADGGIVGVYCTHIDCPIEKALIRQLVKAFDQRRAAAHALELLGETRE